MRHCSTEKHWPQQPGFTTPRARKSPLVYREYALNHHLERMPSYIPWDGEFSTLAEFDADPGLVTVTRCRKGYLTTVMHRANEPYPRP